MQRNNIKNSANHKLSLAVICFLLFWCKKYVHSIVHNPLECREIIYKTLPSQVITNIYSNIFSSLFCCKNYVHSIAYNPLECREIIYKTLPSQVITNIYSNIFSSYSAVKIMYTVLLTIPWSVEK